MLKPKEIRVPQLLKHPETHKKICNNASTSPIKEALREINEQIVKNTVVTTPDIPTTVKTKVPPPNFDAVLDDFLMKDENYSFNDFASFYNNIFKNSNTRPVDDLKPLLALNHTLETNELDGKLAKKAEDLEEKLTRIHERAFKDRLRLENELHHQTIETTKAVYSAVDNFEQKISALDARIHAMNSKLKVKDTEEEVKAREIENDSVKSVDSLKNVSVNESKSEELKISPASALRRTRTSEPPISDVTDFVSEIEREEIDVGENTLIPSSDLESCDLSIEVTNLSESPQPEFDSMKSLKSEPVQPMAFPKQAKSSIPMKRKVAEMSNKKPSISLPNPFVNRKEEKAREPDPRYLVRIQREAQNRAKRLIQAKELANQAISSSADVYERLSRPTSARPAVSVERRPPASRKRNVSLSVERSSETLNRSSSVNQVPNVDEILNNLLKNRSSPDLISQSSDQGPQLDEQLFEEISVQASTNSMIDWEEVDKLLIE
ncbi:hypothetical protein Ciccas_008312 [Cichlidogyrus casuarinus]|uniref:Uncharacterized protein n=1 Tax=Cichlidogyrus casuarinus TaxID=1844966 RepID=A0ABD2Q0F1_9PLAT